jgi:hypothetical protein
MVGWWVVEVELMTWTLVIGQALEVLVLWVHVFAQAAVVYYLVFVLGLEYFWVDQPFVKLIHICEYLYIIYN